MNWLDRLLAHFGYTRREYPRVNMGDDAVQRGERWEMFYRETGGMGDMLEKLRRQYFEAYAALGMADEDKRYEYALADRLARELDREVRTVIETGKIRAAERDHAARMSLTR